MGQMSLEQLGVSSRVRVADGESETGPRVGGRAPDGVGPKATELVYFFTVPSPWSPDEECSVFIDPREEFIFGGNAGRLLEGPGVEVVSHSVSGRRAGQGPFDSAVSEHPLVSSEPTEDVETEDGEEFSYSGHKYGGLPYFVHGETDLEEAVDRLLREGYRQLVQLDFPGGEGDGDVSGPWPVGTAIFHVLVSTHGRDRKWVCFWEQ